MAHIILPSRRMVQPSGPVQLRPEFEKAAVWLFNGHHGNDKAVTTLGSFRATIEKSFPTTDASILAGSPGRFGIRDEVGSNFVGSGFDLAAYKSYLQPSSQVAVLVVFTHILVSGHSAQVWMSSHNRYNNQYGYRFDIQTGTNNLRWWTGNAAWTWNVTATDVLTEGTRYAAMGMSIPNAGQKELQIWHGGRRVAFDNSLADFTITYSGAASDPTILGAHYDGAGFSLGTTPIGPVEMIAQFGSGLSPALAQSLTLDPYQMFEPAKRRIYFPSAAAGVTFEQEGFRWRYDDGDEDGATFSAAQDEPSAASIGITKRLRVLVDVTGNPGSPAAEQFQLQYRRTGSPTEDWKKVN